MWIDFRLKTIYKIGLKRWVRKSAVWYSIYALAAGMLALTKPSIFPDWGWSGFFIPIVVCALGALFGSFPKLSHSGKLISPDSTVTIKIGDIFQQTDDHLVIGTNDVFDTQPGEIVKVGSIQGQFLSQIYGGDQDKLDDDIQKELVRLTGSQIVTTTDDQKVKGKNVRFPIGTVVTLGRLSQRYFLLAYGRMGADLKCTSDIQSVVGSLDCLWDEIRKRGQGQPVSIGVIGTDLARTNLDRMTAIKLIAGSFILASKCEFVTRQLTIIVHPKDIEQINLYEIHDFIQMVTNQ